MNGPGDKGEHRTIDLDGELHYLEDLSHNRVYRFTYVAATNRLKGTVAGTALRPIAIQ